MYRDASNAKEFGIQISNIQFNLQQLQERKKSVIEQLHQGIKGLMKKGKIDVLLRNCKTFRTIHIFSNGQVERYQLR